MTAIELKIQYQTVATHLNKQFIKKHVYIVNKVIPNGYVL